MKKCGRCKVEKKLSEFNKDKHAKDGVCWECKECKRNYTDVNKQRISNYHAQYQKDHPEVIAKIRKKYYNKTKVSKQPTEIIS